MAKFEMFNFDLSEIKTWNRNTFRHKTSWNQTELKNAAWKCLLPNYKWCLLVSLVLGLITQWLYYLYNPGLLLSMGIVRWIARVPKMSLAAVVIIPVRTAGGGMPSVLYGECGREKTDSPRTSFYFSVRLL